MEEIPVRYMLATQYCNRMLLMRAEAMKRVMPDGELEGLRYSESGSDGMGLFSGSEELVGYLRQILTEAATQ